MHEEPVLKRPRLLEATDWSNVGNDNLSKELLAALPSKLSFRHLVVATRKQINIAVSEAGGTVEDAMEILLLQEQLKQQQSVMTKELQTLRQAIKEPHLDHNIGLFVQSFEAYLHAAGVQDWTGALHRILYNEKSNKLDHFLLHKTQLSGLDWKQGKQYIIGLLQPYQSRFKSLEELVAMRPKDNESYSQYCDRFSQTFVCSMMLDEAWIGEIFLLSLPMHVRRDAEQFRIRNSPERDQKLPQLDDLLGTTLLLPVRCLLDAVGVLKSIRTNMSEKIFNKPQQQSSFQMKSHTTSHRSDGGSSSTAVTTNTTRRCYKCGDADHISPNCTKTNLHCSKCGTDGHVAMVCRGGHQKMPVKPNYNHHPMNKKTIKAITRRLQKQLQGTLTDDPSHRTPLTQDK